MRHPRADYDDAIALGERIPSSEPVFLLRQVRNWAGLMRDWAHVHGKAAADTPAEFLRKIEV
jgi:hypothetical protein